MLCVESFDSRARVLSITSLKGDSLEAADGRRNPRASRCGAGIVVHFAVFAASGAGCSQLRLDF